MKKTDEECWISTESSTHTRRCFMTGEYCSQKTNIQRERKKLYEKNAISAFVIMNFSDMSDVVYKWRIETFIESLKKYLYVDEDSKRLYCVADKKKLNNKMGRVEEIKVIRSDSDPASNYVICSRICQQMQLADLVIVDVSCQNPNVFYEFGMAVALDKLILPICFSESFYEIEYPKKVKKMDHTHRKDVEHHIGCYPWRKNLFEYYGIQYKQKDKGSENGTRYLKFDVVTNEDNGFSDLQYNCFPYDERLPGTDEDETNRIGYLIYRILEKQYNSAKKEDNTLVVYTMEGFLNEEQAGRCIVNFYCTITKKMHEEPCFCGERVGVLVQNNAIPERDKDAKRQRNLLYSVGEIIHIGVNQATFLSAKEKVQSEDVMICPDNILGENEKQKFPKGYIDDIENFVKGHIRNRGMIIYPNNPVYVERVKKLLPNNILDYKKDGYEPEDTFCLYHIMLKTLRYTNEIVVDITNNSLQSLFWLGAAHGSEIYAITVKHALSERERRILTGKSKDWNRNVFDVSGLWTAYYYSHDTEGFYHQLALAQFGIEKHSKIIPSDVNWRGIKRWEYFEDEAKNSLNVRKKTEKEKNKEVNTEKEKAEANLLQEKKLALESYYRRRFWNSMLRYNSLSMYLSQHDDMDTNDGEPRVRAAKWDMDAVSSLTHYLSKRSLIGEYVVITLPKDETDKAAETVNFICVGQPAKPLEEKLSDYIYRKCKEVSENEQIVNMIAAYRNINKIHRHYQNYIEHGQSDCKSGKTTIQRKGFLCCGQDEKGIFGVLPWAACGECGQSKESVDKTRYNDISVTKLSDCPLKDCCGHTEIAQLILWREDENRKEKNRHFRVSIIGSSGPATFALSSLFVDESQKLRDFLKDKETKNDDNKNTLLYDLQRNVRGKIFEILKGELLRELQEILCYKMTSDDNDTDRLDVYCNLVVYAVYSYLSTVLYRYFLPFLTEKDIQSIRNGIYLFIDSMKTARQSPFCLDYSERLDGGPETIPNDQVEKVIEMIPRKVESLLESFKGIEAFYEVEVGIENHGNQNRSGALKEKDWRKVKSINAINKDEQEINFFIMPPMESKKVDPQKNPY